MTASFFSEPIVLTSHRQFYHLAPMSPHCRKAAGRPGIPVSHWIAGPCYNSFTLVASLRPLLGFVANHEFSLERRFVDIELPPSGLFNPGNVIPTSDEARLLGRVARHAGVDRLGLLLGKKSTPLDLVLAFIEP